MTFFRYYRAFFRNPTYAASRLLRDPARLRYGFGALMIPVLGYLLVYVGLSRSGAYPSTFTPWLALPAHDYYRYNVLLLPPSVLAGWILASGVVQLLGRWVSARGSFEDTACVLGFAISVGHWTLLPHDLLVSLLGATHVIDGEAHERAMNAPTVARAVLWCFMALYVVAFPVLFSLSLKAAHRVGRRASIWLGCVGFAVYQLVFLTFNR